MTFPLMPAVKFDQGLSIVALGVMGRTAVGRQMQQEFLQRLVNRIGWRCLGHRHPSESAAVSASPPEVLPAPDLSSRSANSNPTLPVSSATRAAENGRPLFEMKL